MPLLGPACCCCSLRCPYWAMSAVAVLPSCCWALLAQSEGSNYAANGLCSPLRKRWWRWCSIVRRLFNVSIHRRFHLLLYLATNVCNGSTAFLTKSYPVTLSLRYNVQGTVTVDVTPSSIDSSFMMARYAESLRHYTIEEYVRMNVTLLLRYIINICSV